MLKIVTPDDAIMTCSEYFTDAQPGVKPFYFARILQLGDTVNDADIKLK